MFNLDEKDNNDKAPKKDQFQFDIEDEIKKDPKKLKELNEKVSEKLKSYKKMLQDGVKPEDMPILKKMIEGYTAMVKILAAISMNNKEERA